MANKKKKIPEYTQAYVPDKEELADLVSKAKGTERSMAEFSRVCKVKGPSTFSRIVNRLIDKPVSDELLIAIAENAADPVEVTLDMLMRANGKVPQNENPEHISDINDRMCIKNRKEGIKLIRDIVVQRYLDDGKGVMLYPDITLAEKLPESKYSLLVPSDFSLHIQGEEPLFINYMIDDTDIHNVSINDVKNKNSHFRYLFVTVMQKYAPLFLRDAWEPETLRDVKNIIVFTEKKAYQVFCDMIKDVKFNSQISVELITPNTLKK